MYLSKSFAIDGTYVSGSNDSTVIIFYFPETVSSLHNSHDFIISVDGYMVLLMRGIASHISFGQTFQRILLFWLRLSEF